MSWTSVEAYAGIADTLTERRMSVLHQLLKYVQSWKKNPTAMELAQWMNIDRSNISNRLSELEKEHHAVHQGMPRTCEVTDKLATTWVPGPADGSDLLLLAVKAQKTNVKQLLIGQLDEDRQVFERLKNLFGDATNFPPHLRSRVADFRFVIKQRLEDIASTTETATRKNGKKV